MGLVSVYNLSMNFSGKELFRDIGFQIDPGERVGLIGPNGSGKTTLLRLINGEMSPDHGEIRIQKGIDIGYLPQDVQESFSGPLLSSIQSAIPERTPIELEISRLEQSLKEQTDHPGKILPAERLAEWHQKKADLDKRYPLHLAEKILMGLGFSTDDFERSISTLSGGWKMRAALAGLLYRNPDLLLLDEPTNHLDFPSVRWLEDFIRNYKGAMLLICHDRDFLNRQTDRVLSFEPEGLRSYSGNYDFYLKVREEERKTLEAKARNEEQKVKEAQRFIERFRAKASKARQAQSKIKLVQKMELVKTHQKKKAIRFSFPKVERSGRDVLTLKGISKRFDHKALYENLDLRISRGERVAILGPNGSGKTTLLRMIAGEWSPDRGEIIFGHGITMSYYAQHHSEMLDSRKTIIEEVYQVVPDATVSFVRGICGAFLFSGNDVDKSIGVLSGGEKARVSLAKILVKPGNFLVMDEPTNHLDIISSEILIDALADYNGTLLFVSHNQSFVNRLTTKVWDIRNGDIHEYPGTLRDYLYYLNERPPQGQGEERGTVTHQAGHPDSFDTAQNRKIQRKLRAEKRHHIRSALKPIEEKLTQIEKRIEDLEGRKKELEQILIDPEIFKDTGKSVPLLNEYRTVKNKIDELMGRWEYAQNELESMKGDLDLSEMQ